MRGWGPARLIATVFGIGKAPIAPGTFGSAVGLALFALLIAPLSIGWQVTIAGTITAVGVVAAERTRRQLAVEDPSEVVVDEVAGMCVAAIGSASAASWIAAFALFRFFDVAKPFPVRQAEALHGGLGIMADDVAAGLYALLLVHLARAGGLLP